MNKKPQAFTAQSPARPFLAGVIEGFYGRTWPHATRLAYAEFLQLAGLNTYLYCPKSDATLRREWTSRWSSAQWMQMLELAAAYQQRDMLWGVGLSPFELYRYYGARERAQLRDKITYLGELEAPLLAVLFDDMPGELDSLASRQAEIVSDVQHWLPNVRLLVCPTYYSYDPILERFFGVMPTGYWGDLGRLLPAEAEVFWTGNTVCSPSIADADLAGITAELGRAVTLWDNYPVNDSKSRCDYLYTKPLSERSGAVQPLLHGHLCNPMNQGVLSLAALRGLSSLHGNGGLNDDALGQILGEEFWRVLSADAETFQIVGRGEIDIQARAGLTDKYRQFDGVAASELLGWLEGDYAFDPACLTD
ncbi:MAG: beta-N-acetylglucosaminidase domain-containing protein [Halioglobus sp.]